MSETKPENKGIRVINTPKIKLKDKPKRQFVVINMMRTFGLIPDAIILEKVIGENNTIIVRAVLNEAQIKLADARIKNEKATENK